MTLVPDGLPAEHDLSTIRLLGTVGEAINPAAWEWFRGSSAPAARRSSTPGGSPRRAPR